jgi:uncharacterized membrane protein YvlD (DUF360 family)
MAPAAPLRPEHLRPTPRQIVTRSITITLANAAALGVLDIVLRQFSLDSWGHAALAGFVVGILNAVVWPVVATFILPLSVLTLGLGSVAVNALLIGVVLERLPGVTLGGFWSAVSITVGLTIVSAVVAWALAVDDDAWFDERTARRTRRIWRGAATSDVPGVVFVQIDGLAEPVLRRALASGDAPTLRRWITDGSHTLTRWETDWSSQTGVSQCGILHGSAHDMPAFRWLDKSTGDVVVSNRRASAQAIERAHSDGKGLLAHNGSSYSNLFSGDAERAVLTMSVAGTVKEGRIGSGYSGYFTRPEQALRTINGAIADIVRERRAAREQRRRDVEPRVHRGWVYSLLRAFTTVVSRDVCVAGVLNDMAEGRSAIYVDLLGYDEVSHHSGPERADTLGVLRDIDRQIARIERAVRWAPRPYRIVVLSDHGQTQGATFTDRAGESLADMVARLTGATSTRDRDSDDGNTESAAWFRGARDSTTDTVEGGSGATVLASGNLGLVYLPGEPRRLFLEEIEETWPGLIDALVTHPAIGFVLVRSRERGSLVLGAQGSVTVADGVVTGEDPLAVFGPTALDKIRRVDAYSTVADLMVNSMYDPILDEVAAFESQVGSHGGLGGPQTHPFVLHPADLAAPDAPIEGSAALHRVLKGWLADLGQPVERVADPA